MNSWKLILATMVIFGTGVVTGGLVVRQTQTMNATERQRPQRSSARMGMVSAAGDLRLEFLKRAQRELDLDPSQRERIDKLIKDSQERTRKLMEPVAPALHAELQQTKEQFLEVLEPTQRKRFDQLVKKQQFRPHEFRRPTSATQKPEQSR